ncbi:MAG: hypothetical protein ACRBCK_12435 [Alphaproteobacteria bacterium]
MTSIRGNIIEFSTYREMQRKPIKGEDKPKSDFEERMTRLTLQSPLLILANASGDWNWL